MLLGIKSVQHDADNKSIYNVSTNVLEVKKFLEFFTQPVKGQYELDEHQFDVVMLWLRHLAPHE